MAVGNSSLKRASKAAKKQTETVLIPSEEVVEKIIQPVEKKSKEAKGKNDKIGIGDTMPVYYL